MSRAPTSPSPSETAVRSWGLLSSVAAPVLLIGGWTAAAARQPGDFDQVTETISALAALDATDRWLMTAALAGVGVCHVATALALRPAALPGRAVHAAGGAATVLVAAFPLPDGGGGSVAHTVSASIALVALAAWPAIAGRRDAPTLLRPAESRAAAAVLLALVAWFGIELALDAGRVGLSERVAAGAQALWPLAVVSTAGRRRRRGERHRDGG